MMIKWICKEYKDLSTDELYSILRVRQEVFILEQNCNYLDTDNYDQYSQHLLGYESDKLVAYMRIVKPGKIYSDVSFGRILVKKEFRNKGLGIELMKKGLDLFPPTQVIVMSAQLYLERFYHIFGFKSVGEVYLEDEIPHIKMIRNG